ncbi:MAG: acetyl-CoA C-acyltransferase [Acidimicrobiaceae bacterium]|jgi:acetyl-CoA acyltransferase|nr:acetyl-CoA C-acyltransferase [Acidimicrobiaceae bacterium]MEC7426395.1 thiolase family protein [Actinomycetota bacterium]MBR81761.1 acetyl-CoA C-acyltransferase [Acidimicrobiaceae bacterium]MBR82040.1 acetyl-CoA C-acyltransferase [Acidimicrobiaceae bacterium]MEC9088706.1 thiolase family protein [Actinomycetota bacterium]|tara:strand:+ start:16426 stop:17595 length:1170 start_codon:yes stop_codon:yes gene_type:complete
MREAVIVDAVRTPGGKRNGKLQDWHAVDLAAHVLKAIEERTGIDPAIVDDVIMGCVMQVGEQSLNIGRNAVLAAGWPESVPATTVDRQCGSSQQALHFAAQGVIAGAYDVAIAAGVEVMTRTPMGASVVKGMGFPFSETMQNRYEETGLPPQGIGAEMIADEYGFTREDLDAFGAESQRRAAVATAEGRFENEIVPVPVEIDGATEVMTADEGIREGTTSESLSKLNPAFREDGKVTAGNSSQITDGASAVLVMSAEKAAELGLRARARFHSFALAGADPVTMLKGPIPATEKVMARSGLTLEDIDLFEVNEAFASVVLAWQKEHGTDLNKTNVNGGAIALGHPLGCSGTKLMATLLNELERTNGRYGLQTMCEGGGMANATIIERLDA